MKMSFCLFLAFVGNVFATSGPQQSDTSNILQAEHIVIAKLESIKLEDKNGNLLVDGRTSPGSGNTIYLNITPEVWIKTSGAKPESVSVRLDPSRHISLQDVKREMAEGTDAKRHIYLLKGNDYLPVAFMQGVLSIQSLDDVLDTLFYQRFPSKKKAYVASRFDKYLKELAELQTRVEWLESSKCSQVIDFKKNQTFNELKALVHSIDERSAIRFQELKSQASLVKIDSSEAMTNRWRNIFPVKLKHELVCGLETGFVTWLVMDELFTLKTERKD